MSIGGDVGSKSRQGWLFYADDRGGWIGRHEERFSNNATIDPLSCLLVKTHCNEKSDPFGVNQHIPLPFINKC